jgi:hypothetical protein
MVWHRPPARARRAGRACPSHDARFMTNCTTTGMILTLVSESRRSAVSRLPRPGLAVGQPSHGPPNFLPLELVEPAGVSLKFAAGRLLIQPAIQGIPRYPSDGLGNLNSYTDWFAGSRHRAHPFRADPHSQSGSTITCEKRGPLPYSNSSAATHQGRGLEGIACRFTFHRVAGDLPRLIAEHFRQPVRRVLFPLRIATSAPVMSVSGRFTTGFSERPPSLSLPFFASTTGAASGNNLAGGPDCRCPVLGLMDTEYELGMGHPARYRASLDSHYSASKKGSSLQARASCTVTISSGSGGAMSERSVVVMARSAT